MTLTSSGGVDSYNDYYPFGESMPNRSLTSSADSRYQYTGKEHDVETQYDYFGARYYDSRIGRWLSVDPLASKYPGWSPYNYTVNNPLRFVDPYGRDPNDHSRSPFDWLCRAVVNFANICVNGLGGNSSAADQSTSGKRASISDKEAQTLAPVKKLVDNLPKVGTHAGAKVEVGSEAAKIEGSATISASTNKPPEASINSDFSASGQKIVGGSISQPLTGGAPSSSLEVGGVGYSSDGGVTIPLSSISSVTFNPDNTQTYEVDLPIPYFDIGFDYTTPASNATQEVEAVKK